MSHPKLSDRIAEFDDYAKDYSGGMDNPLKKLLGPSAASYLTVKAFWLKKRLVSVKDKPHQNNLNILDFGCGTGSFIQCLRNAGLQANFFGCDVSEGMLKRARLQVPGAQFLEISGAVLPHPDNQFDIIIASSVFHHISPHERPAYYKELLRVLRPGGQLVVFEHNPRNPVVRWVVNRTPIDQNAVLLDASEVVLALSQPGEPKPECEYILFSPPRFSFFLKFERYLKNLPLGGQYAVVSAKILR